MNSGNMDIEQSTKYKELFILIEKVFRNKFLGLEDFFKHDVFFLKDDITFHTYDNMPRKSSSHNKNINVMYNILESLSVNGSDFKKLKVQVKKFIRQLCLELIQLQHQKDKITDKIKMFNIDETLNIIEQKLEFIKVNLNSNISTKNEDSFIRISIARLDDFPPGEYSVKLKLRKLRLCSDNQYEIEESRLSLLPTIYKEKTLVDLKDKIKEFTFENQYIFPVDIDFNKLISDEKIMMQYSGTNLCYFLLELKDKHGNRYSSSVQEIIDLYIKLITTFFTDFTQNTKELNLKLVANQVEPVVDLNNYYTLVINVFLEIDQDVRKSILERIYYIFKNTISFRSIVENAQNNLINYFLEQGEQIVDILEKQVVEERTNCGDCSCIIL